MSLAPISFDFGAPATCARAFTHAGREFKVGELFPYVELGLHRHQVHGLWSAHLIRFEPATADAPKRKRK